jgi:peptidoglycan pentaglycine glycine transferase (the first glycine)
MEIKEITQKDIWESFLWNLQEKTFLQSWHWGEFQGTMKNKIWRLGIYDRGKLNGLCLTAKIKAKRGTFFLIQHGPVLIDELKSAKPEALKTLLEGLKEIAGKEKISFIRMAPLWERAPENTAILKKLGFRESPMHANAYEATWKLDLAPSEEELLMKMRKTTRYLIRQAMKNRDVMIEKSSRLADVKLYQKLNIKAAQRQNFAPFSLEYVKNEFEVFSRDNQALLFFGKYKGEPAAAALIVFWSGIGFYHQAASDSKYARFSIPYLLQWEAIKEAKKRGCKLYDFWGFVDPRKNPNHPWAGPTLFKMGFGGYQKEYVKTQDLPLSKSYFLTYLFEKIRKTKRGL